eukprot:scaffold67367_cov33-Phaeocystis_antarctica.AAC.1
MPRSPRSTKGSSRYSVGVAACGCRWDHLLRSNRGRAAIGARAPGRLGLGLGLGIGVITTHYYYYYYVGVVHELSVAEAVDLVGVHPRSSRTVRPLSSVQPRLRARLGVRLSVHLSPPLRVGRVSYGVGGDALIDLRGQIEQVCSEQV